MDVEGVAEELYSLPPGQFVGARDAWVAEARSAGDRDTARAVSALRRPTVVAWLANLLARHHPEDVAPFLELGEALRDATATLSGPELRELAKQRQQLVHALVRKARALGEQAGQRVGEDSLRGLEETLHAALADPAKAEQLVAGRLTEGLRHTGFGQPAPGPSATSRPPAPRAAAKPSAEDERRVARRARIERDLGEAWALARQTADARDEAEAAARASDKCRADAAREVRRLREELGRAEDTLAGAEQEREHDLRVRDRAEKEADRARQRVTDLQAKLDEL